MSFTLLKKEITNRLIDNLEKSYGVILDNLRDYFFYKHNTGKIYISKVYLSNLKNLDINNQKIMSIGIYFGTVLNEALRFRLSIEGTQFVEPKFNFIELDFKILKKYLSAENLFSEEITLLNKNEEVFSEFLVVKYKDKNIGVVSYKQGIYLTYMPKSRKIDFDKAF